MFEFSNLKIQSVNTKNLLLKRDDKIHKVFIIFTRILENNTSYLNIKSIFEKEINSSLSKLSNKRINYVIFKFKFTAYI